MLKFTLILTVAVVLAAPISAEETSERKEAPSRTVEQLPPAAKELADQAKAAFEKGDMKAAEDLYAKAAEIAPDNLYVVYNLGVAQFRNLNYGRAEKAFLKAISIAPGDFSSWCTLGIVQYSQNRFEDATNSLLKSIALNSKNATAHNYLGISAAHRGRLGAAQKELETAIELDPKYADAYFNLAVVYTMGNPPNLEEARKAYKKALDLGAETDEQMEKTLEGQPAPENEKPKGSRGV